MRIIRPNQWSQYMFTVHVESHSTGWQAKVSELPGTLATGLTPLAALAESQRLAEQAIAGSAAPLCASRREFLVMSLASAFAAALAGCAQPGRSRTASPPDLPRVSRITLTVNGEPHTLAVDPRTTLLDALREQLGLYGTKKGCDRGECGACTVHIDGRRANSCMTLAVMQEGRAVTTIEGLAQGDALHPVQAAFIENDAFQCGYCTSGQIMSAVACIAEGHAGSPSEIREWMSGNLCRCSAYPNIVAAVLSAARK
jgi:xanthine dehydrogenase YagT iron-sulfur-binding subunit